MASLRRATNYDWVAVHGHHVACPSKWFGLAVDGRHSIEGLGGAFLGEDDQWWAFFWRAAHARHRKLAYIGGKRIVAMAREAGLSLKVLRDDRLSTSERYLTRLGFEHVEGHTWQIP